MFSALGGFSYRFRWAVITVWLILFAGGVVATFFLGDALRGGGFCDPTSPSEQAAALIEQRLGQGSTSLVVVFSSDTLDARSSEFREAEAAALAAMSPAGVPHLQSVQTYASTGSSQLLSTDGQSSVAVLTFDAPARTVEEEMDMIRGALRDTGLQARITGEAAVDADLSDISMGDLRKVELYALPVALLALVLVFGTVAAAALPVITGAVAVAVTMGALYLLGLVTDMSIFSMNTATLLGLAVAIDYALFIVARFREELGGGATPQEAVVTSTARAGRSVFFSGIAVVIGVLGLTFFPFPGLRSLGVGGALVVFFSVVASLTFMPAMLGVLGERIDSLRVVPNRPPHEGRFWNGWAAFLLKRPWVVISVSLLLIAAIVSPALHMRTEMPSATALPASAESRQGYDILDGQFDRAALSPISVLVTWEGGDPTLDVATAVPLYSFGQELVATPGVASVISIFNLPGIEDVGTLAGLWEQFRALLSPSGGGAVLPEDQGLRLPSGAGVSAEQLAQIRQLVASSVGQRAVLFRVVPASDPASSDAQDLTATIGEIEMPQGFQLHVAGEAAANRDFFRELNGRFPWVMAYVALASYIVLFLLLRSLLLPAVAVMVNALTVLMSFGCLVLIFQDGRFAGVLDFTATGRTDAIMPVVIFCVLFGISMDYAVFSLTRMHEAWLEHADPRGSVGAGLVRSGRVILSAALLVVVVTAAFTFTSISLTKMLGLGIALAIALDAVLVRMGLFPAIMCYLGSAAWWLPSWVERAMPDTGHVPTASREEMPRRRSRPRRPSRGAATR